MALDVDLDDLPQLYDFYIFPQNERVLNQDDLVPRDDDQFVVVADDRENVFEERIVQEDQRDRKQDELGDIGWEFRTILVYNQKQQGRKHDSAGKFCEVVPEHDIVPDDDRKIRIGKDTHMRDLQNAENQHGGYQIERQKKEPYNDSELAVSEF